MKKLVAEFQFKGLAFAVQQGDAGHFDLPAQVDGGCDAQDSRQVFDEVLAIDEGDVRHPTIGFVMGGRLGSGAVQLTPQHLMLGIEGGIAHDRDVKDRLRAEEDPQAGGPNEKPPVRSGKTQQRRSQHIGVIVVSHVIGDMRNRLGSHIAQTQFPVEPRRSCSTIS